MSAIALGTEAPRKTEKLPKKQWPVGLRKHKIRNLTIKGVVSFIGSHWFLFAFFGLYDLFFQVLHGQTVNIGSLAIPLPDVKWAWDHLLSGAIPGFRPLSQDHWDHWRHLFRDGGESFAVSIAVLFFTYNPYAHSVVRITSAKQIVARVALTMLAIFPLFIFGGIALDHFQHSLHAGWIQQSIGAHPNLAQKLYSDAWTTKILVVISAFAARRIMFPVYDYVMRYFRDRRVAAGKPARWYHLPAYAALIKSSYDVHGDSSAYATSRLADQSNALGRLMIGGAGFLTLIAIFGGYYVQTH